MLQKRLGLILGGLMLVSSFAECKQGDKRFEGHCKNYYRNRLDLVAHFIPDDAVIFEAGGHYGLDTVKMSHQWPDGTVHSFEPNPHAFGKLTEKTAGIDNIFCHNLAINNYNGVATLNVCYGTTGDDIRFDGASSLLDASECMEIHYGGPKVEVPCMILDDWCTENGVDYIDFMWLDLEGLELQILSSSPRILETVQVIYTKTNFFKFRKGTTQFSDLRAFLEKSGFTMFAHWYDEGLQGDAIFVRNEIFDEGLARASQ